MGRPRKPQTEQVWVPSFAVRELDQLIDGLSRDPGFDTSRQDLLGALVLAACRLSPELVVALMPAYVKRARAALDAELGAEDESDT